MTDLGRKIKVERAKKGWNQKDLAERTDLSLQTIKNIERGQNFTRDSFIKICEALGKKAVFKIGR